MFDMPPYFHMKTKICGSQEQASRIVKIIFLYQQFETCVGPGHFGGRGGDCGVIAKGQLNPCLHLIFVLFFFVWFQKNMGCKFKGLWRGCVCLMLCLWPAGIFLAFWYETPALGLRLVSWSGMSESLRLQEVLTFPSLGYHCFGFE
jgi:hypothetical protein